MELGCLWCVRAPRRSEQARLAKRRAPGVLGRKEAFFSVLDTLPFLALVVVVVDATRARIHRKEPKKKKDYLNITQSSLLAPSLVLLLPLYAATPPTTCSLQGVTLAHVGAMSFAPT